MARKEFVDLQINGYMGVDFSDPALTETSFLKCAESIFESGTCLFLPTVITSSEDLYKRNIDLIYNAVHSHGLKDKIPGLHLEGPFISPEPGAVGAHNPAYVSSPKKEYLDRLISFAPDFIKILTVAPEREGALELIGYAASKGIKVSMGHNLATTKDIADGAKAGACLITHMGNGIPNMIPRHQNPIWAALSCDKATAMIITDGHHLPAEVIKCFIRVKGVDKIIVTSDAASVGGLPPGKYSSLGNDAVLEPNGLFHNPVKKCLVGSSASVKKCMDYLASLEILSDDELDKVGYYNPMKMIGLL